MHSFFLCPNSVQFPAVWSCTPPHQYALLFLCFFLIFFSFFSPVLLYIFLIFSFSFLLLHDITVSFLCLLSLLILFLYLSSLSSLSDFFFFFILITILFFVFLFASLLSFLFVKLFLLLSFSFLQLPYILITFSAWIFPRINFFPFGKFFRIIVLSLNVRNIPTFHTHPGGPPKVGWSKISTHHLNIYHMNLADAMTGNKMAPSGYELIEAWFLRRWVADKRHSFYPLNGLTFNASKSETHSIHFQFQASVIYRGVVAVVFI